MKDTLHFLVSKIVDHPDDVVIDEEKSEGKTLLTIHANPEDMGKIIGKQGRIIKSIRDCIKILGAKHNTYVDVAIAESQKPEETSQESEETSQESRVQSTE